ncbi:MAG: nucleotidyltransferase domain-containing protein [Bacteroidales bacterium]|nr:nucleotidyltransferase domain-containing protein [Bacteroidales bacterium]MCF8458603.1 nucleotidyltransferase domain-containing protein [Bacteroidales bacterium]
MTRQEVLEKLKLYKDENSQKYGITSLGIFGSYAKNIAEEDSDIDIVIETQEPDIFIMVHIKEELENLFNKSVDIVRDREKINPYLKKQITQYAQYV